MSTTSLTTRMQSWMGSIVPTSCRTRIASGTPLPANPAMATNTRVTSSDGPGCPRKISKRILPPGDRSSHHEGRVGLFLGRISGGCVLVGIAKLMLGVHRCLHGLPRGRQRSIPCRLLGSDLGGKQAIMHGVLEAPDPALGMFRRAVGCWSIGHVLTHESFGHLVAGGPEGWSLIDDLPETI